MDKATRQSADIWISVLIFILVWTVVAWLVYPLLTLDKVELRKATEYFYRSAGGIILMIILFGKTLFDLLFPQDLSPRKSYMYVAFLAVYSIGLAAGIIFMCLRILLVYINANSGAFTGDTSTIPI
jgi:hypothetical protein